MITPQVIIPRPPSAEQIVIKSHYELWKQELEAKEPKFVIENIKFTHDPLWRQRFFSCQTIRDVNRGECSALGPTIIWTIIKYGFLAAGTAPYLLRIIN